MRVLITGASGFAGSHLADLLLQQDHLDVWGVARSWPDPTRCAEQMTIREVDLTDPDAVNAVLDESQPARIYHLAGQAFVPDSWTHPWATLENNIRSQLNLLQGMIDLAIDARILCVSSMEVYGQIQADELPVDEGTPLRPDSPYGVSKVAQDMLAAQYHRSHGLYTVIARPYNHFGPHQDERFVAPAFAKQIAEIEAGLRPPTILVGNLEAQRDFTDVRDVVRAYYFLMEKGKPGEAYNIGSGVPRAVRDLLDHLLAFSSQPIEVRQDPARLRPSDVPVAYADITKVRRTTGWEPQVPFHQSIADILEEWRLKVAAARKNQ